MDDITESAVQELYGAPPSRVGTNRVVGFCACGYSWPVIPRAFVQHLIPIDRQCCPSCGQPAAQWEARHK